MNATEIEFIQGRLPAALRQTPSAEQMARLMAVAKRERNQQLAASFGVFVDAAKGFMRVVRRIAASCSDARLHQSHA